MAAEPESADRPDPETELRNPVPWDMPTDPPLEPRPFADPEEPPSDE